MRPHLHLPWPHLHRRRERPARAVRPVPATLRAPRAAALWAVSALVLASAGVSFAESYRGLFLWAQHHGLHGVWSAVWPLQVDVFIAVGELSLFIALVNQWRTRSRVAAWFVTLFGLTVSVAGNVGHITSSAFTSRATAAVPPLAAAAALAVGLGVLKRIIEHHAQSVLSENGSGTISSSVFEAAKASMRATAAAGNPWSANALAVQFSLPRREASELRTAVLAETNGHDADGGDVDGS